MKRLVCICAVLTLLLSVVYIPAAMAYETMYVYTANGKSLNVRSSPQTGENRIGTLKYGSEVLVDYHRGDGWTLIFWSDGPAFVQTKFLVYIKPAPYVNPDGKKSDTDKKESGTSIIDQLNAEYRAYTSVTPYDVVTTHSRSTGLINMRFAPNKQAWLRRSFAVGKTLRVIAQLKDWYEVEDLDSGETGFIRKDFLKNK